MRRAKALFFSGCESRPSTFVPAGSNWSRRGGKSSGKDQQLKNFRLLFCWTSRKDQNEIEWNAQLSILTPSPRPFRMRRMGTRRKIRPLFTLTPSPSPASGSHELF